MTDITATIQAAATTAATQAHTDIVAQSTAAHVNVVAAIAGNPTPVTAKPTFEGTVRAEIEGLKAEVSKFFHAVAELPEHAFKAVVHAISIPAVAIAGFFKRL